MYKNMTENLTKSLASFVSKIFQVTLKVATIYYLYIILNVLYLQKLNLFPPKVQKLCEKHFW